MRPQIMWFVNKKCDIFICGCTDFALMDDIKGKHSIDFH